MTHSLPTTNNNRKFEVLVSGSQRSAANSHKVTKVIDGGLQKKAHSAFVTQYFGFEPLIKKDQPQRAHWMNVGADDLCNSSREKIPNDDTAVVTTDR